MTREEKCQLAIKLGYTYNPITGDVTGMFGKVLKSKHAEGYLTLNLNKKYKLLQHQLVWYITYGMVVESIDHINGIKDDNRICNLRSVTNQENAFNRTKAKGYYWNKRDKKWQANIKLNGKSINLGYFITEEEARQAYLDAKLIYHLNK